MRSLYPQWQIYKKKKKLCEKVILMEDFKVNKSKMIF